MRYLSVCSGIEAATVAWHPLGWRAAAYSEIEAFPRAVLAHHYPDTPCHGDFTTIGADEYGAIDLLVGGTPCQSFSIAGLRGGLADDRGNLALEFLRLAQRTRAEWLVWENVPGVLSSNGGRDFGAILGGLVELGYGWAYRVLDAQFFGVPQRRRRVFVVGHLGDWRRAAAVLFERHGLSGYPAPRREKREDVAGSLTSRASGGGGGPGAGTDEAAAGYLQAVARCITAREGQRQDYETETLIAPAQRAEGFDASEDGTGRGTPLVPCEPFVLMERGREGGSNLEYRADGTANAILTPNGGRGGLGVGAIAFSAKDHGADAMTDCSPTLRAGGHKGSHANAGVMPAVAFAENSRAELRLEAGDGSRTGALSTGGGKAGQGVPMVASSAVRRLTPRECERLQGFPDDYTLIPYRNKPAADGPRYKALGNSMAVPVMRWIGERINAVRGLEALQAAAPSQVAA